MTTSYDIRDELRDIICAASGVPAALVSSEPDNSLADMGLDSLASMELQAAIDDRFRVRIPEDSLEMSFHDVCDYVITRMGND